MSLHGRSDRARKLGVLNRIGNLPFLGIIYLYRATLSPLMGGQCRFEPTCSRYGLEAYQSYGPIGGSVLTIKRILRCHPFHKGGYDPVPIKDDHKNDSYDEQSNHSKSTLRTTINDERDQVMGTDDRSSAESLDRESEQGS